jgi:pimeloyl-ACP methyl ester carboxylesterase
LDWASHLEVLWEQPFVQELVSSLERFARVLWFDMRGIGLSDRALDAPAAPEDWLDDVAAVMDAAGSARAALVAHGHAAQMALLAAAIHPDRIDSLVFLNGFARFARADDYPAGRPEAGDAVQRAGLEVRSSLHTGEVTQVNGDVAGIAVHIGARVSELAQPGEVLVTRTVRDLVAGSEIRFDDRGEFPLRGVGKHWELCATSN